MLQLSDITLCCIDTRYPQLGLNALHTSMREITYGEVVFITTAGVSVPTEGQQRVRLEVIEPIRNAEEYSHFVLTSLAQFVRTPSVLLIQWDGYVINPQAWADRFRTFDYIGPPWILKGGTRLVGNGGFSLRSRKLLETLSAEEIQLHHPEDDCIAKTNRSRLETDFGIRFADPDTADLFAYEFTSPTRPSFGFHGLCHFPDVMSAEELYAFIDDMPNLLVGSGYFPGFLERLQRRTGSAPQYAECMTLIRRAFSGALANGLVPKKQVIKALINSGLDDLARAGLDARIRSAGHTSVNLRLLARYAGGKFGIRW